MSFKEYVDGKGGGTWTCKIFHASRGHTTVTVQQFPEDQHLIRIVFDRVDDRSTITINRCQGHCLWSALNGLAESNGWQDDFEVKS